LKLLFVLWTVVRNAFEAVIWATLVRTAAEPFYNIEWVRSNIEWVPLFWVVFVVLGVYHLNVLGSEPWLAKAMVMIDPMLVGLAILQALACALIPTVITIVVANLIHMPPNWLHVYLSFACGFYILWRRNGKKKAIQSWKGEPKLVWQQGGHFKEPTPINHLPEWQQEQLTEHRRQHSSKKVEADQVIWTRESDGSLVTEVELYWATVMPWLDKIGFAVYSKKSGQIVSLWYDCTSEKQAMDLAIDWMLRGKSPDPLRDAEVKLETEKQPDNAGLQTERDLVGAMVVAASKGARRIIDLIPEREKKWYLIIQTYLEYLCFVVHVNNRLASNVASYHEVDRMYKTIVPLVREYVIHEVFTSVKEEHT
jgi:hypothetical protein